MTPLTDKEINTLNDIAMQLSVTFRAQGITHPTEAQISAAFVAQVQAEHRIVPDCSLRLRP